jgi:hypothetical protein
MAQLHLAFTSPVTAVERNDEGKFSHQLRKLDHLAVLIGKLYIRKSPSDALIHVSNPFLSLKDYDFPPETATKSRRLHFAVSLDGGIGPFETRLILFQPPCR